MDLESKTKERILTLSASKLALWDSCPMAFFLRYIQHEKIPENVALTFGKTIHYYANIFYSKNFKSPESFANSWKRYWWAICSGEFLKKKNSVYEVTQHTLSNGKTLDLRTDIKFGPDPPGVFFGYMTLGKNILTRFYKRHKIKAPPEEREKRRIVNLFGHKIIIIFDRIDRINGRLYVTDYKTDKKCPDKDSFILHRAQQFTIYSAAAKDIFGVEDAAILYYHLRSGQVLKTKRSERDFIYLQHMLNNASEGIEKALNSGDFVPRYGYRCNFCDSKVPCERYSISHGGPKIIHSGEIIPAEPFTEWYTPEELNELLIEER